jgi:hypothetical protein
LEKIVLNIFVLFEASKLNSTTMLFYITWKIPADISVYNMFGKMTLEENVDNAELNISKIGRYHELNSGSCRCITEIRKLSSMNL